MARFDLVVLGSGAAGLAAALHAAARGASVLIAEKSRWIGGTTAMSGGCTWVPCNHHMASIGERDSREDALAYLHAVAPPGWAAREAPLWEAFVDAAPRMLRFVEEHSPLRFGVGLEPDGYLEAPGARRRGRNVSPRPYRMAELGAWARRVRPSPMPSLLCYNEITDTHLVVAPRRAFTRFGARLAWRWLTGRRAMGQAMVGALLKGCLAHGATVRAPCRGARLLLEAGRVAGVRFEDGSEAAARLGVVIATGGFEWNQEMMARHHPGPYRWTASPEENEGDGHRMALEAGAALDRMGEALTMGARPVEYLGRPFAMPAADYTLPHSMIVDARGRRFVNEVQLNVGLGLEARDESGKRRHHPAWRIYDAQYARKYPHALPSGPEMVSAGTLEELARAIGVDPPGLEDEAARMGRFARIGVDEDFGRGSHGWDPHRNGDPRLKPNSCLGSIERPPFHAFPFPPSFLGTKGGPRTDAGARVLRPDAAPIPGLYCAGNAMANPIGSKAVGAGTTLGPCLAWGWIAARSALADAA
ncbi:MAG: FAD-dependent oxidoreductase [Burkholderiales bacterium]|nr:FAD-dependent oxidoreductase [Burkholderiales bacterium]